MVYARHPAILSSQNILAYTGRAYRNGDFVTGIYFQQGLGNSPDLIAAGAWNFSVSKGISKIVYEIADEIFIANYDGSEVETLLTGDIYDNPAISPDGNFLAYSHYNDVGDQSHIELMNLQSRAVIGNLSNNASGSAYNAAWSPDSKFLAYELEGSVYILEIETGNTNLLNTVTDYRSAPSWSPDGNKIAFAYGGDIYTVKIDGSERTQITNTPDRSESEPAWSY